MMRLGIWAIFIGSFFTSLLAQDNRAKFERLSIEDGLTHTIARQVIQDHQGFLWFITPNGANRYDGYQFHTYQHDPYDTTSLSANSQNTIYVDRSGTVWIGNFDGLCRYQPATDNFVRYQHQPDDSTSLTVSYTSAICEDRSGNIWVATGSILHRLDQDHQTFEAFPPIPGDPFRFSTSLVQDMLPDPRPGSNALFLATAAQGLVKFNIDQKRFTQFLPAGRRFHRFMTQYSDQLIATIDSIADKLSPLAVVVPDSHSIIRTSRSALNEKQKVLLICGGEGDPQNLYDKGWLSRRIDGKIVWQAARNKNRHMGGHFKNRLQIEVLELSAGEYILHYQNDASHSLNDWNALPPKHQRWWGIHAYPLLQEQQLEKRIDSDLHLPEFVPGINITSLYYDSLSFFHDHNVIWLGTQGQGAARLELPDYSVEHQQQNPYFDIENSQFRIFNQNQSGNQTLSSNFVMGVFADRKGNIWFATANGLNRLEQGNRRITHYSHDPANSASISANYLNHVFEDHSRNLWIASSHGVNKLNRQKHRFLHYTGNNQSELTQYQLPGKSICALFEDSKNDIWISTYSGCITRMDPASGHYEHYPPSELPDHPLRHMVIRTFAQTGQDSSQTLWLGTQGQGLARFDHQTDEIQSFMSEPNDSTSISGNSINRLIADRKNRLWIGYNGRGIDLFDVNTKKVAARYRAVNLEKQPNLASTHLGSNEIWALLEDQRTDSTIIWIGTVGAGLNRLNAETGKVKHYPIKLNAQNAINSKTVTDLFQDDDGFIWVGTYSGGINKLNPATGLIEHFTVRKGLSNNMVTAIRQDREKYLWISTSSGLNKLNPLTSEVKIFDVNDGLQSNQFNLWVSLEDSSGRLYFGGIEGFNSFHPDSLEENLSLPPVLITDFRIFDRSVLGKGDFANRSIYEVSQIDLDYQQNFFAFEFVTLDYKNPQKNEYAYMLEGFDQDWIYCGQRRYASYTNLDPGEYVFHVKGANSDGIWNIDGPTVAITIAPPFYRTWWFSLLSIFFLAGLAWSFHNYRLRTRINRMREIERVRKKAAADFHDELGHKLTKISLFSELAGRQLNGNLPETADYVKRIHHISGSLYHNMRDFLWTLDPSKDTLYEVAIKLKDFGDEFFDNTGIHFRVEDIDKDLQGLTLNMDWKRHLVLIFKEAMNNILRHSECENVHLTIHREDRMINIKLSDDGKGFALPVSASSHGIANMKDRADGLGGTVSIEPNPDGKGTIIHFTGELT